ncbi:MAG: laccase domain-containing protein, partial [Candidatus Lindowbacteria bacterium]|nr:laccase domain-containing protein [Candidatus Lindowbacteria bacterium]
MSTFRPENSNMVRRAFREGRPFDRIVAAFTTRRPAAKASHGDLNTGLHTGDDPINVIENRRLVFGDLELDPNSFTAAQQVHGDNIERVDRNQCGMGALHYQDAIPATDALITDVPGIPIGVFTADCVPIFLYDPGRMAVGIVHAGWRSTVLEIASKTVKKMAQEFGSN